MRGLPDHSKLSRLLVLLLSLSVFLALFLASHLGFSSGLTSVVFVEAKVDETGSKINNGGEKRDSNGEDPFSQVDDSSHSSSGHQNDAFLEFRGKEKEEFNIEEDEKVLEELKKAQMSPGRNSDSLLSSDGPMVLVELCTACHYGNNFHGLRNYLVQQYPQLQGRVFGRHYATKPFYMMLQQLIGAIQMVFFSTLIFGDSVLRMLGIQGGETLNFINENRTMIIGALFFSSSMVQNLSQSGAFEIWINGELAFSKLKSGRFPTMTELTQALERAGIKQGSVQHQSF